MAEARARAGRPIWLYQVDFACRADPRRGAFHDIDLPLVFGTTMQPARAPATMRRCGRCRARCRTASSPSRKPATRTCAVRPPGRAYDLAGRATMIFDVHSRVEHDPRRWQRELFARAPYVQPGS